MDTNAHEFQTGLAAGEALMKGADSGALIGESSWA